MACATVAFTDSGSLAGTGLRNVCEFEDQQVYLEPEISSALLLRGHRRSELSSAESAGPSGDRCPH